MAVHQLFYKQVVWASLVISQTLGGGLPDIITNISAAM